MHQIQFPPPAAEELRTLGKTAFLVCGLVSLIAVAEIMSGQGILGLGTKMPPLMLAGAALLAILGFVLLAIGDSKPADRVESPSASSTRAKYFSLSDRIASEDAMLGANIADYDPGQNPEAQEVMFNATLLGHPWRSYADGHVEADFPGRTRKFKDFDAFEAFVTRAAEQDAEAQEVLFNAILEGYAWRKYADGHIEAEFSGRTKKFKDFDAFEAHVNLVGPAWS